MSEHSDPIRNGEAVSRFLGDSTIREVFAEMELLYFEQWKAAETQTEREALWAKVSAFSDLKRALQAVADAGTLAADQEERKARARATSSA